MCLWWTVDVLYPFHSCCAGTTEREGSGSDSEGARARQREIEGACARGRKALTRKMVIYVCVESVQNRKKHTQRRIMVQGFKFGM